MDILIVDDTRMMLSLIADIVEDMGNTAITAHSGEQALEIFSEAESTIGMVLLDVHMPGLDGYEVAGKIKAQVGSRHLPVVFLTGSKDTDVISKCLSVGDDYIAKPFSEEMVISKINAHQRISTLYSQLETQFKQLKSFQHHIDVEHQMVESIFSAYFAQNINETDKLRYHMSPKSVFNGDVLLTGVSPSGNIYLAVGDVTGHGLPAAVGAIPAYSVFQAMAAKGLSVGKIAFEMNRAVLRLMPDHMMLALIILEVNAHANTLTVWSGGMPAMVIADSSGRAKQFIEACHCPLAMLNDDEFSQDVKIYDIEHSDRIYLYTDGVEEHRNGDGEMFGEDRLFGLFDGTNSDIFQAIIQELEAFSGGEEQDDDVTLVEILCSPLDQTNQNKVKRDINISPWKLSYRYNTEQLKRIQPVSQMVKMLSSAPGVSVHQDYISTIISELYNNAVDHGVLKLDSSIKADPEGFFEYYRLRQEGLQNLQEGSVSVDIELLDRNDEYFIVMTVIDSGEGFDYSHLKKSEINEAHGRGIQIIKTLCSKVEWAQGGREVKVEYQLH